MYFEKNDEKGELFYNFEHFKFMWNSIESNVEEEAIKVIRWIANTMVKLLQLKLPIDEQLFVLSFAFLNSEYWDYRHVLLSSLKQTLIKATRDQVQKIVQNINMMIYY